MWQSKFCVTWYSAAAAVQVDSHNKWDPCEMVMPGNCVQGYRLFHCNDIKYLTGRARLTIWESVASDPCLKLTTWEWGDCYIQQDHMHTLAINAMVLQVHHRQVTLPIHTHSPQQIAQHFPKLVVWVKHEYRGQCCSSTCKMSQCDIRT